MKNYVMVFVGLLLFSTFAKANEVCGLVKRLSAINTFPFSKIEFSDGNEISADISMGREALVTASMANGLKLCFKYDGRIYVFSSVSN